MNLPDTPLIDSTLGLINGDLFSQKLKNKADMRWGSDSSLTLATIESLSNGYSLTDIMTQFTYWYTTGAYTMDQTPQAVGTVTKRAIEHFQKQQDPFTSGGTFEEDNANGSLLRITPVILYLRAQYGENFTTNDSAMLILHQTGGLTHNHPRSLIAIGYYAMFLNGILSGLSLSTAVEHALSNAYEYYSKHALFASELTALANLNTPDFENTPLSDIVATGYVIDSLTATVWVLLNSHTYVKALSVAAELPGEPERILPLVGAVAGALYGYHALPTEWLSEIGQGIVSDILINATASQRFTI